MKLLSATIAILCLLAMCLAHAPTQVQADNFGKVKSANLKKLKSEKADERIAGVEAICATGDKGAASIAFRALLKEKNPLAAQKMGKSLKHLTSDEASEEVVKQAKKLYGQSKAFSALWVFTGLALGKSEAGTEFLTEVITAEKTKRPYQRTAALEALAVANRTDLHKAVTSVLLRKEKDWEKNPLVIITACTVAARTKREESVFAFVKALADVMENYESKRVKRFAAAACGTIADDKPYASPRWWRQWVKAKGKMGAEEKTASGKVSDTAVRRKTPKFFGVEAVGNRLVFVIDRSGSMMGPVTLPPQPKKKKAKKKKKSPITGKKKGDKEEDGEIPPPDYSKVKTKLDLAKVELIYSITHLDEDFEFNVVTYHTGHDYLIPSTQGFVKATKGNKRKFIRQIQKLATAGLTNIHGSLIRAFRTTTGKPVKGDPALDANAFKKGAETIFFLTDGFACWCDATATQKNDGPFSTSEGLLPDIVRVNTFRKVVINTIGIGFHDSVLLEDLAASSGGTYRSVAEE